MSEFRALQDVRSKLSQITQPFSWEAWFSRHIRELAKMEEARLPARALQGRLESALQAMKMTGALPSVAKLIETIVSLDIGSPVRSCLMRATSEHIADCIVRLNFNHELALGLIEAARTYQVSYGMPLEGHEDASIGIIGELANFVQAWLASL